MMYRVLPSTLTALMKHDPSIVDEQMQGEISGLKCVGTLSGGMEGSQVQLNALHCYLATFSLSAQLLLHPLY